jgi:hypothetical protein
LWPAAAGWRSLSRPSQQSQAKPTAEQSAARHDRPSVGLIPLVDLGTGTYQGRDGGLYAGSRNVPPQHQQTGEKVAAALVPLDAKGGPSPGGRIVLLAIGFSDPNLKFPAFQQSATDETQVNPQLVLVNGSVEGQRAHVIADPNANYWSIVDERLTAANVTREQVEAIWLKLYIVNPGANPWETEVKGLHGDYIGRLHNLHDRFPNVKTAYLTSRSYGGYTEFGGSPEPAAYETGLAVKRDAAIRTWFLK